MKTISKAQSIISARSDKELISDWKTLDSSTEPVTIEQGMVRGWYMEEIQKRWPEQYDKWIENCFEDDDIEHYINVI